MTSAADTSAATRTRRSRNAVHATITLTPCEGPEGRILVSVNYAGTDRLVPDLCWSKPNYDTAAALGNTLWALMNTVTVQQALNALPNLRDALTTAN